MNERLKYCKIKIKMNKLFNADETNDAIREKSLKKFEHNQTLSEIYFAYQHVHRYVVKIFT